MSIKLLDRESTFTTTPLFYAYKTLKLFDRDKKTEESIFRVLRTLKEGSPEADAKQLFYGLIFLQMNGILELEGGMVKIKYEDTLS